ncbi:MAG: amidohydrolase [Lentisphaeria bacterium]|nr:amidohydrolase [Lentisphaeria bacterium]
MNKNELKEFICHFLDEHKQELIDNGEYLLHIPELAYKEYKTSEFVAGYLAGLGLNVRKNIAITGVRADLNTGKPGPVTAVLGELDALIVPDHPFADTTSGAAHACGHHAALNAMLGCAKALCLPEVLQHLSGKISFMATPSEECQDQPYIASLIAEKKLQFFGGKSQMIAENEFKDTQIALMLHAGDKNFTVSGFNGFVMKRLIFKGKSAHAGAYPEQGINAISMMRSAMAMLDAQRDTFRDEDHVRIHGYIPDGGQAVNVVPHHTVFTLQVRGATPQAVQDASEKVDRCVHAAAIAFGGKAVVENIFGFMPLINYPELDELHRNNVLNFIAPQAPFITGIYRPSSTDMGDVSMIKPSIHGYFRGFSGTAHTVDFLVTDPVQAYVDSAKMLALNVIDLLYGDARTGREIAALSTPMDQEEYLQKMHGYSSRIEYP